MSNKYWVPGGITTNWSDATNWRTVSGGTLPANATTVPGTSDGARFDGASGSGTVTLDISPTIQSLSFSGTGTFAGTFAFGTNTVTLTSTGTVFAGATSTTITGTNPLIILDNTATSGTRTINASAVTEANSISFNIISGSGTAVLTITGSGAVRDLNFTGFTGSHNATAYTMYGSLTLDARMTVTAGSTTTTFAATSGIKTITTNGVLFDKNITFNGVGGTWQLQGDLTSGASRTTFLTNGTLNLNNYTFSTGLFTAAGGTTKAISFGTGNITATGTGTVFTGNTAMTVTGTPLIVCTDSSAAARTISMTAATEANAISCNVTAGTGQLTLQSNSSFKNIDLTGFSGSLATSNPDIYGNFVASSTMTMVSGSSGTLAFRATSGTKTINTNGVFFERNFTFNGVNGAWQLQGALTLGSTRTANVVAGSLSLNNYTLTVGTFNSNNANARTLTFGTGSIVVTDTPWNTGDVTNLTTDASGTISMSSASAKSFNGGSRTWGKLQNSGIGTLTILGANTFMEISNSVVPAFFVFPAGETTSAYTYTINGTASNLVSLRSSSPGTQYTLAKL